MTLCHWLYIIDRPIGYFRSNPDRQWRTGPTCETPVVVVLLRRRGRHGWSRPIGRQWRSLRPLPRPHNTETRRWKTPTPSSKTVHLSSEDRKSSVTSSPNSSVQTMTTSSFENSCSVSFSLLYENYLSPEHRPNNYHVDVAASMSWRHVEYLSKARRLAVARPKLSGRRSFSTSVREYVFFVFFRFHKNVTFYVFLKRHFKRT